MKIYLAGPCDTENRYNMVQIAKVFRKYGGYEVYCPWELKIENAWEISQEEWARKVFEADIKAIQECDTFVMITPCTEEEFKIRQFNDNLKIDYCQKNNIPLIIIPYTHLDKLCLNDLLLETTNFRKV